MRERLPNLTTFTKTQIDGQNGSGYGNYLSFATAHLGVDPVVGRSNSKWISGAAIVSTFKAYGLVSNFWVKP